MGQVATLESLIILFPKMQEHVATMARFSFCAIKPVTIKKIDTARRLSHAKNLFNSENRKTVLYNSVAIFYID